MKKLERILGTIAILSVILKLIHVPLSSMLLILSTGLLAVLYYFSFALLNGIRGRDIFTGAAYKQTTSTTIILGVVLGFALAPLILGVMFKLSFWPGSRLMLFAGLSAAALVLFLSFLLYKVEQKEFYSRVFRRLVIIGGISLAIFLTPSKTLVDIMYRNHPAYSTAFKNVLSDPKNEEFQLELERQRDIMNGRIPSR